MSSDYSDEEVVEEDDEEYEENGQEDWSVFSYFFNVEK